jgi:catechol O-methyltransferase
VLNDVFSVFGVFLGYMMFLELRSIHHTEGKSAMAEGVAWHLGKNLFLLWLSVILLPISTALISLIDIYNDTLKKKTWPGRLVEPRPRTVLITGVSMAKGLSLARLFHCRGHRVIGADHNPLSIGRASRALDKFYALPIPAAETAQKNGSEDAYTAKLLDIAKWEFIDLWVSVSDVNAAAQDAHARDTIEAQTSAKCVQLSAQDVQTLHEKDSFIRHTKQLGLPVPDTEVVSSHEMATDFLAKRGGLGYAEGSKRYLIKPLGVDDFGRFDMPILPLATDQETRQRVKSLDFWRCGRFLMQEFIEGDEYCTHALVIRGQVRSFVSCRSSGVLMHYTALPPETPLSRSMLEFTQIQAKAGGENFTGHISFDFLVPAPRPGSGEKAGKLQTLPIECNPRVHTATVLFNNTPELVDEYIRIVEPPSSTLNDQGPIVPATPCQYYWIGQDLVELVIYPMYQWVFQGSVSFAQVKEGVWGFAQHVLYWKDGTFETWDPWPWWWLYHVYWPAQFLGYIFRGRWHKINVSTGKAFKAQ